MEEKKAKIQNSLRTNYDSKFSNNFFLPGSVKRVICKTFRLNQPGGFTLVEILIVVAILGILAAGFLTIIDPGNQLRGARDSKRKANLKQIQTALELYRADCGAYPAPPLESSISSPASCTGSVATYLSSVPKDPKDSSVPYTYSSESPYSRYQLIACLERTSDPEGSGSCAAGPGKNYTVTNP